MSYQGSAPYPTAPNTGMVAPPYPGPGNTPHQMPMSKIELRISCRKLVNKDYLSKSDPFVVVYLETKNKEWREVGRTEVITDCLDPDFVTAFFVDYYFEERQNLKFEVYDSDAASSDLSKQDFIGMLVVSLGSIVGENCGRIEKQLQNVKDPSLKPGAIIVKAEEVSGNKDVMTLHLCGKKIDKKDFFGKSDPFLVFEKCNEDNSYTTVYKTEVIKNTLNPTWKPFNISLQELCNGDYQRPVKVTCYDWNRSGSHEIIGSFQVVAQDFVEFKNGRPSFYELINQNTKAKKKSSYKHSGTIHIIDCSLTQKLTFLDYIKGGLALNFIVAVDFTASNGVASQPNSLHYNGSNQPSQYVQVLQAIGGIIEDYDTDKLFPAFGFGAKLPPTYNDVSHEFALNFNPHNPYCQGVHGIIASYYHSINNVQLYGPTNFSPIIQSTVRIARDAAQPGIVSQYYVLLIITDGVISDMDRTKYSIVEASSLPISIIIVGVGNADFEAMEELDGDAVRLSYAGKFAERDIVQFVPFRDFMHGNTYSPATGDRLAQNVLHELPEQIVGYMESRGIKPSNPAPS